jgi:hypothetical protein
LLDSRGDRGLREVETEQLGSSELFDQSNSLRMVVKGARALVARRKIRLGASPRIYRNSPNWRADNLTAPGPLFTLHKNGSHNNGCPQLEARLRGREPDSLGPDGTGKKLDHPRGVTP